ncbi:MerR family transcriptional regulator [Cellulomonas terrae]|uniref:MerR family transcriptional regulator n=1 Tax=Cellulomonas terrae TaxID=311234 RepID=A0A511JMY0_9CELL|nr:MerR family transcriptional regulator [Cellulomonas terrae]GEL98943.1 MerR family transcriptional regulator [Cellulomonas terrae]
MSVAESTDVSLSIAEAAEATGLTTHTLRYYERDGLLLDAVDRASSGHRRYSEDDVGWIRMITRLRSTGMPIREVRQYADLVRAGDGNEAERLQLLVAHRDRVRQQLSEVATHLEAIEYKIGLYERSTCTLT